MDAATTLLQRCRYDPDVPFTPFLTQERNDDGVQKYLVLPPSGTLPPFVCQHCLAVGKIPDKPITSIASQQAICRQDSTHAAEWKGVSHENSYSSTKHPHPFYYRKGNGDKWLVVPPTNFQVVCAGCVSKHADLKTIAIGSFHVQCRPTRKDDRECGKMWKGHDAGYPVVEIQEEDSTQQPADDPPEDPPQPNHEAEHGGEPTAVSDGAAQEIDNIVAEVMVDVQRNPREERRLAREARSALPPQPQPETTATRKKKGPTKRKRRT